jgi:acyl-ACP thioesterase
MSSRPRRFPRVMAAGVPQHEIGGPPASGRTFSLPMRPLLGDCAPSGRMRLDAIARWAQDVAYADIEDAGLEQVAIWVVRRTRIKVLRFPRFAEHFEVQTFASGLGRMWAQRSTILTPAGLGGGIGPTQRSPVATAPVVELVSLWIHLDPVRLVPSVITEAELDIYAEAAGDRRCPHRLTHPRPKAESDGIDWFFRRTDTDLADHINNAAYWEPLEEELLASGVEHSAVDAELEFRVPAQPGRVRLLRDGPYRWLTEPEGGEVYASMLLRNASTTSGSN